jgi:branched-chain amino acid transport system permease protein
MLLRAVGRRRTIEIVVVLAAVLIPITSRDPFVADRLGRFAMYAVLAMSLDLLWGFGGMISFGQAAFFGWGGYVLAVATTREEGLLPLSLWAALPIAVVLPASVAFALGWFAFSGRLAVRGVYFAVFTFALAVLSEKIAFAGTSITGGRNGIIMSEDLAIGGFEFDSGYRFYAFALCFLASTYVALRRYLESNAGLVLKGVRENEERLTLLGHDVARVKRLAFTGSAAIASLAGALFYAHDGIITPTAVGIQLSTQVLVWVLIGGLGTLLGPVVGAVALSYLAAELSGTLLDTWLLVVGVVLVAVILFLPSGLLGFAKDNVVWKKGAT